MIRERSIGSWRRYYENKQSTPLQYPDENLVRLLAQCQQYKTSVLDFGCGMGRHLQLLNRFQKIYAVDSSPIALDYCKQRYPSVTTIFFDDSHYQKHVDQNSPISFTSSISNVQQLLEIIPKHSLDCVIVWGILHYMSSKQQKILLKTLSMLLRPMMEGQLFATIRAKTDTHLSYQSDLKNLEYTLYSADNVRELFVESFHQVELGYQERCPVGNPELRISHWIVRACTQN